MALCSGVLRGLTREKKVGHRDGDTELTNILPRAGSGGARERRGILDLQTGWERESFCFADWFIHSHTK